MSEKDPEATWGLDQCSLPDREVCKRNCKRTTRHDAASIMTLRGDKLADFLGDHILGGARLCRDDPSRVPANFGVALAFIREGDMIKDFDHC